MDIVIPGILAGGSGPAIAQTGEEIGRAGRSVGDFLDNIQKNYNYNSSVGVEYEFEPKFQAYHLEFLEKDDGSDPDAFKKYQEGKQKLIDEEIGEAAKINRDVEEYVKKSALTRSARYDLAAQEGLYKNMIKKSIKVDGDQAQLSLDSALSLPGDPYENMKAAIEDNKVKILSRQNLYGGNAGTVFEGAINKSLLFAIDNGLKDPQKTRAVLAMMQDPKAKEEILGYLTPEGRSHVQGLLQSTGKDMVRQDAYSLIYNDFKGDFSAMNEALTKPDVQKKYGLGMEDAFYIKGQISAAQADKDKADSVRYDKTAKEVFLNLNKMTPGKIDRLVLEDQIDYKLGEHFKTELKQLRNGPSDPMTYFRLYTQVKNASGDPDATLKVRSAIFSSSLSFDDKKAMLTMTESGEDKYESGLMKQGAEYIKNVVMPSQTLISAAKPKEAEHYLDAMRTFEESVAKARGRGEKINGETVNRIAKEVAATYSMTIYDQMDAAKEKMRADKAKAAVKDKFGYAIGQRIVKNGKTYVYVGNNIWE